MRLVVALGGNALLRRGEPAETGSGARVCARRSPRSPRSRATTTPDRVVVA
jgi:carbamate kinase